MKKGVVFTFVFLLFVVLIGSVSAVDFEERLSLTKPFQDPFLEEEPIPEESNQIFSLESFSRVECGTVPTSDCEVTSSTTFQPGSYNFTSCPPIIQNCLSSQMITIGVFVSGDNIVLDCNGADLYGVRTTRNKGSGITITGNNVTIKNCKLRDMDFGITLPRGNEVKIINNNFDVNKGIVFRDIMSRTNVTIAYNNFTSNGITNLWSIDIHDSIPFGGIMATQVLNEYYNVSHNNFMENSGTFNLNAGNTGAKVFLQNNYFEKTTYGFSVRLVSGLISNNVFINTTEFTVRGGLAGKPDYSVKFYNNTKIGDSLLVPGAAKGFRFSLFNSEIFDNTIINVENYGLELGSIIYPSFNNTKIAAKNYVHNNYIENLWAFNPYTYASYGIIGGEGNIIENNTIIGNNTGIGEFGLGCLGGILIGGNSSIIAYNDISGCQVGVWFLDTAGNNTVHTNYIHDNLAGIYRSRLYYPNSTFRENTIRDNIVDFNTLGCGISLPYDSHDNEIYGNSFNSNSKGICVGNSERNNIWNNSIKFSSFEAFSFNNASSTKVYLNTIEQTSATVSVVSDTPLEVSYGKIGNYWGYPTGNAVCFIPGLDSNALNVVDSHAYCGGPPNNIKIKFPTFGWYLFGSNIIPLDISIENVLNPITGYYDLVQSSVNGDQRQYNPIAPFGNDLLSISPRNGYWMKINSAPPGDLVIVGNEVNPSSCYRLSLTPTPSPTSWIGYWASGVQPIATALSSITGNYSLVRTYEDGAWKTYDPLLIPFSDLDFMKPGQGYIITITNSDDLDYLGGFCPP